MPQHRIFLSGNYDGYHTGRNFLYFINLNTDPVAILLLGKIPSYESADQSSGINYFFDLA